MIDRSVPAPFPEIVLLRHGETQWNRVGRYQGQQDSPLTLTGIGQLRAISRSLRPHLRKLDLYQVWSSPLTRTRQSVSIICEELGLPYEDVNFDGRLMERAYGRWEGLTIDEILTQYPEDMEMEKADRWNFCIPGGGESFASVADRLRDWLNDISDIGPVIVMAHGGSGRVLRGICTNSESEKIFAFNDPQCTSFLISDGRSTTVNAESEHLLEYGCEDSGLGVRI